jgi:hypothetical protein
MNSIPSSLLSPVLIILITGIIFKNVDLKKKLFEMIKFKKITKEEKIHKMLKTWTHS